VEMNRVVRRLTFYRTGFPTSASKEYCSHISLIKSTCYPPRENILDKAQYQAD